MKTWQFWALQTNIQIACSLSAVNPYTKGIFLFLAVLSLVAMFFTLRVED